MTCRALFASDSTAYEAITDSWATIVANIKNGTYADKYHRGMSKTVELPDGSYFSATIVGMGADIMANGNPAPISFAGGNSTTLYKWHNTADDTDQMGWETCDLRATLNSTVLNQLPSDIRNNIVGVKKSHWAYKSHSKSGEYRQQCVDNVWVPSFDEMRNDDVIVDGITVCNNYYIVPEFNNWSHYAWLRDKRGEGTHYTGDTYKYDSTYSHNTAMVVGWQDSGATFYGAQTATVARIAPIGFCLA